MTPGPRLTDAHPVLAERWTATRLAYGDQHPGKDAIPTCIYRSAEAQQALFQIGRSKPGAIVTNIDGATKRSNHNLVPARALDFCVLIGGKVTWDEAEYGVVGALAEAHGLIWGGHWKTFTDRPHVELPKEIA